MLNPNPHCTRCRSNNVRKYGIHYSNQYYFCNDCQHKFVDPQHPPRKYHVTTDTCCVCGKTTLYVDRHGKTRRRSRLGMCDACYWEQFYKECNRKVQSFKRKVVVGSRCSACGKELVPNSGDMVTMCKRCYKTEYSRRANLLLKSEVIVAYGGKCECCGETEPYFLVLDHVNGGGGRERSVHRNLYFWLKKCGWPNNGQYRILCANCNIAIAILGNCPHTRSRMVNADQRQWQEIDGIGKVTARKVVEEINGGTV